MTDTQWADVSEFNPLADDHYRLRGIAIRSNDGTYKDKHFANNIAWAKHACDTGKLDFFIVYLVYEPNWLDTFNTFKAIVGKPHPKMAVMIDMESWKGRIRGDQSQLANLLRANIAQWLGSYMSPWARLLRKHWKRVGGYGNAGDLTTLWAGRPRDMWIVLANYSFNQDFPNKLAHQYSDRAPCIPFGLCDMNSADGMNSAQVVKALGLDATVPPTPVEGHWTDDTKQFSITADATGKMNLWHLGQWVRSL